MLEGEVFFKDDPSVHLGFHTEGHDPANHRLYYGKKIKKGRDPEDFEIKCDVVVESFSIKPFTMIKDDSRIPYVFYNIQGTDDFCPASEFSLRLRSFGILLPPSQFTELTNYLVSRSVLHRAYDEPKYVLELDEKAVHQRKENIRKRLKEIGADEDTINKTIEFMEKDPEGKEDVAAYKIRLIGISETYRKYRNPERYTKEKDLREVIPLLKRLYDITTDKKAFVIAFSYSLFAPLAYIVRKMRLFFPNLIFLGLPEAGKNSLLNLFLAKMWDIEENIKVTGDFRTDFSSMRNIGGSGLPIIINDLDQPGFEKLKSYLLEGAMNPKGGSRGKATLELQEFDTMRGIAISSNYLKIGGEEYTSRFLIHVVEENKDEKASGWNDLAEKLVGAMYPVARHVIDHINSSMDGKSFIRLFRGSRKEVKRYIVEFGAKMLEELFQGYAEYEFRLPEHFKHYEEYIEDHFSIFYGWVEMALKKMERETAYSVHDIGSQYVTLSYENSLYIRSTNENYIVFRMAWEDFLKRFPDFPFKSMEGFAHSYPEMVKYDSRKFSSDKGGRMSTRVLIVKRVFLPNEYAVAQEEVKA